MLGGADSVTRRRLSFIENVDHSFTRFKCGLLDFWVRSRISIYPVAFDPVVRSITQFGNKVDTSMSYRL